MPEGQRAGSREQRTAESMEPAPAALRRIEMFKVQGSKFEVLKRRGFNLEL